MSIGHAAARVAALAGVVLLAACGQDAPPPQQAETAQPAAEQAAAAPIATQALDPCGLLTAEEGTEAIGRTVTGPTRNEHNDKVCEYTVEGGGIFNFMTETVAGTAGPDEMMKELQSRGVATREAPGIGARSFWAPQMGMTQLNTYQGGNHIILTMAMLGNDAQMEELAQKVMAKVLAKR